MIAFHARRFAGRAFLYDPDVNSAGRQIERQCESYRTCAYDKYVKGCDFSQR